jgi:hypothetical protein
MAKKKLKYTTAATRLAGLEELYAKTLMIAQGMADEMLQGAYKKGFQSINSSLKYITECREKETVLQQTVESNRRGNKIEITVDLGLE